MDKLKNYSIKAVVLVINAALVIGGAFFIKNGQQKKQAETDLVANISANQDQQAIATQAQQLQQIVDQNRNQKIESLAQNTGTVTIQKPTVVTQTIPAKTSTVTVPVSSSSSSTPAKTTKKS